MERTEDAWRKVCQECHEAAFFVASKLTPEEFGPLRDLIDHAVESGMSVASYREARTALQHPTSNP